MKLTFLGAAGCVTGSRTLVETGRTTLLVDCGMFQGYKPLRLLNWKKFPVNPAKIQAVVLTHAHLDHSGWLPRLLREGFHGAVYCSAATRDLCKILLLDAARIQEADARRANAGGYTKHRPARPLYTVAEAKGVLRQFKVLPVAKWHAVGDAQVRLTPNGHILGSCMVEVKADETVLWSGDLGRPNDAVMPAPAQAPACDRLVLESTYGDRLHGDEDPVHRLRDMLERTAQRRGVLLIPSFAVGRSQAILLFLAEAMSTGAPRMPVYLDSPMSEAAMKTMTKHLQLTHVAPARWQRVLRQVDVIQDGKASAALASRPPPFIVLSSSGMLTGGRVLNHLLSFGGDPRNTILLAGHQAGGTRGADLLQGEKRIKVLGRHLTVKARIERLANVSAHADQQELLAWVKSMPRLPQQIHLNHGELGSADRLRQLLRDRLGCPVDVPALGDSAGRRLQRGT